MTRSRPCLKLIRPPASTRSSSRQREEIVTATVTVVAERGFAETTVEHVVQRAGVSRATFYSLFEGIDQCMEAAMDDATDRSAALIAQAFELEDDWRIGVRHALAALLMFFDREVSHTRVWFVDVLTVGTRALEYREQKIAALRTLVTAWWSDSTAMPPRALAAEGVMVSLLGVIQRHLLAGDSAPLITLLGPLTGIALAPFVDPATVEREMARARELASTMTEGSVDSEDRGSRQAPLPRILRDPRARRARQCVLYIAEHPTASNRQIIEGIGIVHREQASRLLARLSEEGLISKSNVAAGRANAWQLTTCGKRALRMLLSGSLERPSGPA